MEQEQQIEFIRFLIKQMREYSHELNVYRAVALNAKAMTHLPVDAMVSEYRSSAAIRELTELQFSGLDELVESLRPDMNTEAIKELLLRVSFGEDPN